jgi:hypothetical protein
MWQRLQVFAFALSGEFEKCVRREIGRRHLTTECRRQGVLIARGLLGPTVSAIYRAAHLALGGQHSRVQPARALFRAAGGEQETRVREIRDVPISGHARVLERRRVPA